MAENTSESKNNAFGKANDDWAKHLRKPEKKRNNKHVRAASKADVKQQTRDLKEITCAKCGTADKTPNSTFPSCNCPKPSTVNTVSKKLKDMLPVRKPYTMPKTSANELNVQTYKDYHAAVKDKPTTPKREKGVATASQLAVTKILGRKNEAIDYDDLDDRYDTKKNVGGKLGKKGQLIGKPVGSRAAQQRHELPRKNRLDKVRNTMKEIGAPIVEGPPMMTREEAKAWLQEKVSKNRGKESLEDRKKKALHAYHARMLGKENVEEDASVKFPPFKRNLKSPSPLTKGSDLRTEPDGSWSIPDPSTDKKKVKESQGDLFDSPPKKTAPTAPTAPKAAPTAPKPAAVVKKAAPTAPKPAAPTSSVTKTRVKPEPQAGLDATVPKARTDTTHTKVVGPSAPPAAKPSAVAKKAGVGVGRHVQGPIDNLSGEKAASTQRTLDAKVKSSSNTPGVIPIGSRAAKNAVDQVKKDLGNDKPGAWTAGVDKVKKVAEPKDVDPYAGAKKLEKDKKWKDVVKTEQTVDEANPVNKAKKNAFVQSVGTNLTKNSPGHSDPRDDRRIGRGVTSSPKPHAPQTDKQYVQQVKKDVNKSMHGSTSSKGIANSKSTKDISREKKDREKYSDWDNHSENVEVVKTEGGNPENKAKKNAMSDKAADPPNPSAPPIGPGHKRAIGRERQQGIGGKGESGRSNDRLARGNLKSDEEWGRKYYPDVDRAGNKRNETPKNEDVIDEISTTSGAGGYETPGAFAGKSHTAAQLKKKEVFGYKLLPAGKKEFYRDGDKLESIVPQYTANMKTLAESILLEVESGMLSEGGNPINKAKKNAVIPQDSAERHVNRTPEKEINKAYDRSVGIHRNDLDTPQQRLAAKRFGDRMAAGTPKKESSLSAGVAVKEYKKPHQQIGQAVQHIHRQLAQIEKCVAAALKTKTEGKVANTDLWKRTFKHLLKLDSRLTNLAREIREIRT